MITISYEWTSSNLYITTAIFQNPTLLTLYTMNYFFFSIFASLKLIHLNFAKFFFCEIKSFYKCGNALNATDSSGGKKFVLQRLNLAFNF